VSSTTAPSLRDLTGVLGEVVDTKRIHVAGAVGSLASRRFLGAWAALCAGEPLRRVAITEAAAALCAARLGGIDARVLTEAGLTPGGGQTTSRGQSPSAVVDVLGRAYDEVAGAVASPLREELRAAAVAPAPGAPPVPPLAGESDAGVPHWIAALAQQPRAGATRPGHPRLMLHPAESHAEHCWVVAAGAVLAAGHHGAEPELPFLCGLAHHAHNAVLPDAGFAGEALLGDELEPLITRLTERALDELPRPLADRTREALALRASASTPEARAFHTADVLDRVLEMRHHERQAAFTVEQALDDLDLVHAGPLQAFGLRVVEEAGLR
jgi:5'-deoxynucleotidase YfbR-like HD superfamily hydrolase